MTEMDFLIPNRAKLENKKEPDQTAVLFQKVMNFLLFKWYRRAAFLH
jgi:hypothetical protein